MLPTHMGMNRQRCEAILAANSAPGANTIVLPTGTYTLTISGMDDNANTGDLDITDALILSGAGAESTFVSGGASFDNRIFQ